MASVASLGATGPVWHNGRWATAALKKIKIKKVQAGAASLETGTLLLIGREGGCMGVAKLTRAWERPRILNVGADSSVQDFREGEKKKKRKTERIAFWPSSHSASLFCQTGGDEATLADSQQQSDWGVVCSNMNVRHLIYSHNSNMQTSL